jgi:hypothetical protein
MNSSENAGIKSAAVNVSPHKKGRRARGIQMRDLPLYPDQRELPNGRLRAPATPEHRLRTTPYFY